MIELKAILNNYGFPESLYSNHFNNLFMAWSMTRPMGDRTRKQTDTLDSRIMFKRNMCETANQQYI